MISYFIFYFFFRLADIFAFQRPTYLLTFIPTQSCRSGIFSARASKCRMGHSQGLSKQPVRPSFWTGNCHRRRAEKQPFWTILHNLRPFWPFQTILNRHYCSKRWAILISQQLSPWLFLIRYTPPKEDMGITKILHFSLGVPKKLNTLFITRLKKTWDFPKFLIVLREKQEF